MRTWLDIRNQKRSDANREARYLIGSCRRDEYADNECYRGSAALASRWMEMFGERTRYRTFEYRALETAIPVQISEAA